MFKQPEEFTKEDHSFINRIMNYQNNDVLKRYMKDHEATQEEAEEAWKAWKQFAVTSYFLKGRKTTSQMVDNIWHIFILHTRQYAQFCEEYWGGHFLHHEPSADEESPNFYFATRDFATRIFSELNEDIWPSETGVGARCISGGDCRISCRSKCTAK